MATTTTTNNNRQAVIGLQWQIISHALSFGANSTRPSIPLATSNFLLPSNGNTVFLAYMLPSRYQLSSLLLSNSLHPFQSSSSFSSFSSSSFCPQLERITTKCNRQIGKVLLFTLVQFPPPAFCLLSVRFLFPFRRPVQQFNGNNNQPLSCHKAHSLPKRSSSSVTGKKVYIISQPAMEERDFELR